ncbi:DUF2785 domain-containing protein [Peribacillus sp. NPDC097675]|uniref:DUF2785 domain-containing protein n=1 Tax=Peribacillus sp. NPDC097675 TaxID=3390618 RepID=UPI003D06939A
MSVLSNTVPMKANELKTFLRDMKDGEKTWEEASNVLIVKSMLIHIGSLDSDLRDHLIYSSFYQIIIEKNLLEPELLTEILDLCLRELLFKGIGENGTDTVFTRSFTTLLIALILYKDNEDNFLSPEMVYIVKDRLIDYLNSEMDLRGYVSAKGWAHSIAHVADAFNQLVESPKVNQELYADILNPIWNKVFVSNYVYAHDEDERLLTPILGMLKNGLDTKEIESYIQYVPEKLRLLKDNLDEENYWFLLANCKRFLKSFYIKVMQDPSLLSLQKSMENCLKEM